MVDKEKCRTGDHFNISTFRGTKSDRRPVGAVTGVAGISLAVKGWTSWRWSRKKEYTSTRGPPGQFQIWRQFGFLFLWVPLDISAGAFQALANPGSRKSIGKGKVNLPIRQDPGKLRPLFLIFGSVLLMIHQI